MTQTLSPTGAPTWPPCVTYRASGGQTSLSSFRSWRPPPVTRQIAGVTQSSVALHSVLATMFDPLMSCAHTCELVPTVNKFTTTVIVSSTPLPQVKAALVQTANVVLAPASSSRIGTTVLQFGSELLSVTVRSSRLARPVFVIVTYHTTVCGFWSCKVTLLVNGPPSIV